MRVLLVDDHPFFIEGLANLLASRGVEVIGRASDGFDAVSQVQTLRPDVVLMDIRMPRCDGLEATQLIKDTAPETKVVMLTSSAESEDITEAMRRGASGYLLKSLDAGDLFSLLHSVTSQSSRAEAD